MVENERALLSARLQFEMNEGVDAWIPMRGAPGLNNPLARDELNIAADNQPAKHREGASGRGIDCRRHSRKRSKLFLLDNRIVKTLRTGFEVKLVMD